MLQQRYYIAQATMRGLLVRSKVPVLSFINFRITLPIRIGVKLRGTSMQSITEARR